MRASKPHPSACRRWLRTALLYQKWVPGMVTPEHTDAAGASLTREASAQAHEHEFAADAFAAQRLQALGMDRQDLLAIFFQLGVVQDSATHPGTRKRMAALRAQGLAASGR